MAGLVACSAGPGRSLPSADQTEGSSPRPARATTITIGQMSSNKGFGPWEFSATSGGGASLAEIHTVSLVSEDQKGNIETRLAARLPSLDDGSIAILPDGRMRTTWRLRPDVRWHDGAPFTASDLVLSWKIAQDPELLSSISPAIWHADAVEAEDPLTATITWKTTFFRALQLGHRNFWPFPEHVLAQHFDGDKQAFRGLPYFTTEYVHLGPFRLVDYGMGEQQVFERFDGYFLGRPKVDTIVLRTISDANSLLANLKAGTIDMASEKTLPGDLAVQLRDEWRATGDGVVLARQDNWLYVYLQFDPQWARPPELMRDVRIRRGLLHAMDREAIREFALPGFPYTNGDTFVPSNDPRAGEAGEPFSRYRFDPARAIAELAEAGWRRSADGRLLTSEGRQPQVEVRGATTTWVKEVALIADFWRRLGIDAPEVIPSEAVARDREWQATFPAATVRARGSAEDIFVVFDSRLQATSQNRWQGANYGHYGSPALEQLLDHLWSTLDTRGQGELLRQMGEILATDLPALPVYFRTTFAVVRKGIYTLQDDYAATQDLGAMARGAHLWYRD